MWHPNWQLVIVWLWLIRNQPRQYISMSIVHPVGSNHTAITTRFHRWTCLVDIPLTQVNGDQPGRSGRSVIIRFNAVVSGDWFCKMVLICWEYIENAHVALDDEERFALHRNGPLMARWVIANSRISFIAGRRLICYKLSVDNGRIIRSYHNHSTDYKVSVWRGRFKMIPNGDSACRLLQRARKVVRGN